MHWPPATAIDCILQKIVNAINASVLFIGKFKQFCRQNKYFIKKIAVKAILFANNCNDKIKRANLPALIQCFHNGIILIVKH